MKCTVLLPPEVRRLYAPEKETILLIQIVVELTLYRKAVHDFIKR